MKKKAVFLDRDGVLNDAIIREGKPYSPMSLSELTIPIDVQGALHQLKSAGFLLIGATNQPDVARGNTDQSLVEAIHQTLMATLPLDDIRVCYHDDRDGCECRKPLPGLILQAAKDYEIDVEQSFMIGDRWKDIAAGQQAGCKTIWIDRKYAEKRPVTPPDFVANSLGEAAKWILEQSRTEKNYGVC